MAPLSVVQVRILAAADKINVVANTDCATAARLSNVVVLVILSVMIYGSTVMSQLRRGSSHVCTSPAAVIAISRLPSGLKTKLVSGVC